MIDFGQLNNRWAYITEPMSIYEARERLRNIAICSVILCLTKSFKKSDVLYANFANRGQNLKVPIIAAQVESCFKLEHV